MESGKRLIEVYRNLDLGHLVSSRNHRKGFHNGNSKSRGIVERKNIMFLRIFSILAVGFLLVSTMPVQGQADINAQVCPEFMMLPNPGEQDESGAELSTEGLLPMTPFLHIPPPTDGGAAEASVEAEYDGNCVSIGGRGTVAEDVGGDPDKPSPSGPSVSVSSSTHPDQGVYYSHREDILDPDDIPHEDLPEPLSSAIRGDPEGATFDWSANNVDHYILGFNKGTATPSRNITQSRTTTIWTSPPLDDPFGTYTFAIQALGTNGLWGPIKTYRINVDVIPPDIDEVFPEHGATIFNPFQEIIVDYSDMDDGWDASERTSVDPDSVNLIVNGIDINAVYGNICAPQGPDTSCILEIDENQLRFRPSDPWDEDINIAEIKITDESEPANEASFEWVFFLAEPEDPANEDLPIDVMDPTNIEYLQERRVDAVEFAEETVEVADQLIAAAITGDVSEALDVLYEHSVIGPPASDAVDVVELTEEALLALVKCVEATDPPTLLEDVEGTSADASQCANRTLLPFLDALLNRTAEQLPLVGDTVADFRTETLPGIVDTADSIAPLELQATSQDLMDNPVGTTRQSTLDTIDFASDPANLQQVVTQNQAAAQIFVSELIQANERHPQFLYDTILREGLETHWPTIQEANDNAAEATDDKIHPIAVADSFVFNLYTERDGEERITSVPVGQRTCIQLSDTNTTTRDANDCDLYATLMISEDFASNPADASSNRRITPSLEVETALPAARFELEALGYLQLPDSPYVIVLGYATTGSPEGQPQNWRGSLVEFNPNEDWNDRSFAVATSYEDPRGEIPLHIIAGSFKVEVSEPGKPVVPGYETVLEVEADDLPDRVMTNVQRKGSDQGAHRLATILELSDQSTPTLRFRDMFDDHEALLILEAEDLGTGANRIVQEAQGTDSASWHWTSQTGSPHVASTFREMFMDSPLRAFQATITDVPTDLELSSDSLTSAHSFQATSPPTEFSLLLGEGSDECPEIDASHFMSVDQTPDHLCLTADLSGYIEVDAQITDNQILISGGRASGDSGDTKIIVHASNDLYAELLQSPANWVTTHTSTPTDRRTLEWEASEPIGTFILEADVTNTEELLRLEITDLPESLQATLHPISARGELEAADYVSSIEWITTTTATAPTAEPPSGGDYLRIMESATDVESAWRLVDLKATVSQVTPDGAWEATGDFLTNRPLELYYEDDLRTVQLEASEIEGQFLFRVSDDPESGLFSYNHQLTASSPSVRLAGDFSDNRVLVDLVDAPAEVTANAHLDAESFSLDASGPITEADVIYAPGGNHPTKTGRSFLVIGGTAAPISGFHGRLEDVSSIDVFRSPGTLELTSDFRTISPLDLRFDQGQEATVLQLSTAPDEAAIIIADSVFEWTSSASSTTFDFLRRGASGETFISASVTDAPDQLGISWSPRSTDSFETTVTHSGTSLAGLDLEDRRGVPNAGATMDGGFRITATQIPPRFTAEFKPTEGRLHAESTDATGTPRTVGSVDLSFGERRSSRLVAPQGNGLFAFLEEQDGALAGALTATALDRLEVHLFSGDQQTNAAGTLLLERASGGSVYIRVDSASREARGIVHYDSAPDDVSLTLWPGHSTGGFRIETHSSAIGGILEANLVQDGRRLGMKTSSSTPEILETNWLPGQPLAVSASSATDLVVQATNDADSVPAHPVLDHVAVKPGEVGLGFGMQISGVTSFFLDPVGRTLASQVTGEQSILIDHGGGKDRVRVQANPLPNDFQLEWDPSQRTVDVMASSPMSGFLLTTDPGEGGGQRLLVDMDGVPSGSTVFSASPSGEFMLKSPSTVSRARITFDFGVGAPSILETMGIRVQAAQEQPEFWLNLQELKEVSLDLPPTGNPKLSLLRGISASSEPAEFRLGLPGQRLMAELDALPGGVSSLSWPSITAMDFSANGVTGRAVTLGVDAGDDRGQVHIPAAPSDWDLSFTGTGSIDYTASGGTPGLEAFATWNQAAFTLTADGVSHDFSITTNDGMESGGITTTSGDVQRLRLGLVSSGSSGNVAVPVLDAPGMDYLSIDSTTQGGMIALDLPDIIGASWNLPGSAGRLEGEALVFDLIRSASSSRASEIQFVHPDHQTRTSFRSGLPAELNLQITRDLQKWTLEAGTQGKRYTLQHQVGDADALRVDARGPPSEGSVSVEPKGSRVLDHSSPGSYSRLQIETRWNDGFLNAVLSGTTEAFRVFNEGDLLSGTVSTLGSGTMGRARVFVVPDSDQTANRVKPSWEHLAVETTGKTPYMSLNLGGFSQATWELPGATERRPVTVGIDRPGVQPGDTHVVFSGPREDVTAKISDPSSTIGFSAIPSTNTPGTLNPDPINFEYLGGSAARMVLTHLHLETRQTGSVEITDPTGPVSVEASGAEPAWMGWDSNGASRIKFRTTDGGTLLHFDVFSPTPKFRVDIERGDCGVTSPFEGEIDTLGTGTTGPAEIFIGDSSRVPNLPASRQGADIRCMDGQVSMAMQNPLLVNTWWTLGGGECSYLLDAVSQLIRYRLEVPRSTIDANIALWDAVGSLGMVMRNQGGFAFDASSRIREMTQNVSCPDSMQFIEPVEWFQVAADDAVGDLVIDLNPKPRPGDNLLMETIEVSSPSGDYTDSLHLQAKVDTVRQNNEFSGQLRYLSPFGELDVRVADSLKMNTALGLHKDRISAVVNDGLSYHTHFTDVSLLRGDVQHLGCGADDEINVDYQRISGKPAQDVSFWMDFGHQCDKQLFHVEPFPAQLEYNIKWEDMCDNSIHADLSSPINRLAWWRSAQAFCPISSFPAKSGTMSSWFLEVLDAPTGPLTTEIQLGRAGQIHLESEDGLIGHVGFGVAAGRGHDWYVTAGLNDVKLFVEWDFDGDTKFSGHPRYIYGHTFNQVVHSTMRMRFGSLGVGLQGSGWKFDEWQLGWSWNPVQVCWFGACKEVFKFPTFSKTGSVQAASGSTLEVMMPNGRWYEVPGSLL